MHAFLKLTKVAERCEKLGWGATSEYRRGFLISTLNTFLDLYLVPRADET